MIDLKMVYIIFKFITANIGLWTLIIGILSLIYLLIIHYQNQRNFFISLILDLDKIAENSDSYKDVILQSIQTEKLDYGRKELFEDITKTFKDYLPIKEKKELQRKIKEDKQISNKLHDFGHRRLKRILEIYFDADSGEELKSQFLSFPLNPQYLPHNLNYDFYSKNINYNFPIIIPLLIQGKQTLNLKRRILILKRHIDIINFQISMLNHPDFIPYVMKPKEEKEPKETWIYLTFWYRYYYQICKNLLTLDQYIYLTYEELRKFVKPNKNNIKNIVPILTRKDYLFKE